MEDNEVKKPKFCVKPVFNLLYEIGMPTGRKIRNSLFVTLLFVILYILLSKSELISNLEMDYLFNNFSVLNALKIASAAVILVSVLYAVICAVVQALTYKHISYTFYDKYLVYEDDFLNQHKKTIQYDNIKEVEIRRTVWDRILGFGIIVIYTNAENSRKNGMVLYGIKNVSQVYESIEKLVHNKAEESNKDSYVSEQMAEDKISDPKKFIENMEKQVEK